MLLALQLMKNAFVKRNFFKKYIQQLVALLHLSRKHRNIRKVLFNRETDKILGTCSRNLDGKSGNRLCVIAVLQQHNPNNKILGSCFKI
jgi:hypothetical protein